MKHLFKLLTIVLVVSLSSCEGKKLNIFTVQQDIDMGREVVEQILESPNEYPILDRSKNKEAYAYVEKIRDKILATGELKYADKYDWDVYIIDQDVLNAFAVPGGTTFYYTGLLKYLDDEASLAGVMGHEFAHADKRHATTNMTKVYGYETLLNVVLGKDNNTAVDIAKDLALGLGSLKFSRNNEYEADEYAVKYLYKTDYDARGVAYFFEKLEEEEESSSSSNWLVYFSTHPNPEDRIEKIYEHHKNLGGNEGNKFTSEYQEFKKLLK